MRRASGPADRRVSVLALTAAGRRLIARIFPPHAAAMRRALAGLAPRERAQARELLKKLGKSAAVTPSASEGPL